ncbi:hypothetical protein ScalyP_jg2886 [Parmales sp. scaly parma]|nr:hypothetical protein ScalyP_jg2886 [Parmales sp. scaly parma]
MYDPILADLRSHTLDYLKQMVIESGGSHRCMFEFDGSMVPREGDKQFVHQMSIRLALSFPQSALNQTIATAQILSGAAP